VVVGGDALFHEERPGVHLVEEVNARHDAVAPLVDSHQVAGGGRGLPRVRLVQLHANAVSLAAFDEPSSVQRVAKAHQVDVLRLAAPRSGRNRGVNLALGHHHLIREMVDKVLPPPSTRTSRRPWRSRSSPPKRRPRRRCRSRSSTPLSTRLEQVAHIDRIISFFSSPFAPSPARI